MERHEALSEILDNLNIELSDSQVKQVSEDFSLHIEMEAEMESYQHVGHVERCGNCDTLNMHIRNLENDISSYQNGVRKRHPKASHVYIENGDVKYDL